jgi:hypothetical protein
MLTYLAVEMAQQIDEVMVLEEQWAILAYSLHLIRVGVWHTIAGGVDGFLACGLAIILVTANLVGGVLSLAVSGAVGAVGMSVHVGQRCDMFVEQIKCGGRSKRVASCRVYILY